MRDTEQLSVVIPAVAQLLEAASYKDFSLFCKDLKKKKKIRKKKNPKIHKVLSNLPRLRRSPPEELGLNLKCAAAQALGCFYNI